MRQASSTCLRRSHHLARCAWRPPSTRCAIDSGRTPCSVPAFWAGLQWSGTGSRLVIQATLMRAARKTNRDFRVPRAQAGAMASREEAAGAAWEGADLERPILGENPESDSLEEARRWVSVYSHLVKLEQDLLDVLAGMIPTMPGEAQMEAEQTNLPVLASQVERFRHRMEFWSRRRAELESRRPG